MAKTPSFVQRDHELERGHETATEALAEHRWHWTLDESNPDRVSLREYARQVGRTEVAIRSMSKAYEAFRTSEVRTPGGPVTINDFLQREKLSAETAEATQAVAVATGKTFGAAAHQGMRREVKEVLATAQDRAERKGTTVSEELPRVAESREKARKAHASERADRQRNKTFFLVQVEGHLGAAIRQLREALALVRDVDFDEEQVELLEGTLDNLRTLVKLIDVRVTGETGIDWDAEFTAVMEEAGK